MFQPLSHHLKRWCGIALMKNGKLSNTQVGEVKSSFGIHPGNDNLPLPHIISDLVFESQWGERCGIAPNGEKSPCEPQLG
jgi:hypothetical protein